MKYKIIDTAGQKTAVITSKINLSDLPKIASVIMNSNPNIEQVGLLQGEKFAMMGGELSLNGLLAGAFLIGKSGQINNLSFRVRKDKISLTFPNTLVKNISKNIIYLQGIAYQVIKGKPKSKLVTDKIKNQLTILAGSSPASGLIFYRNNQIWPLIYVTQTNTHVWENACGSGSLSFAIVTGKRKVIQPSGEVLNFKINKNNITVTASVKEI